ncbi:protein bric-a-brac 1-like [Palaemon carinicauda]|uniref:protein bric-a-brac 1-like n=1 Tax=Palaemon carinicauda TaxID=392227 RepID=UPI0035B57B91
MMGGSDMQFCLRWNNFGTTMTAALHSLHEGGDFVDVTLAADGMQLKAHKLVLSACSPYFRDILRNNPCQHPVIILREVPIEDLEAVVAFMYEGQVNVSQTRLHTFMKLAEVLQVRGLTDAQTAWSHVDKDSFLPNVLASSENGSNASPLSAAPAIPSTTINTSSVSSPVVQHSPMQTVQARFRTHDSPSPPPKRRKSSPGRLRNSPKPVDEEEENPDTKRDIRNMLEVKMEPDEYPEDGVDLGEEVDHHPLPAPEINLLEQSPDAPLRTGGGSTSSLSIPSVFLPQHIASEKSNRHLLSKRNSQEKSSASLHLEFPQGPSCQNLPYPCPFCEKAYTSWGFRRRHIKGYHTSSPELPCKWCYRVLPSHQHWEEHVTRKHNLAMDDARNGLLILEEAHMVLQIAQPTRIDSLMLLIKNNKEKEGEEKKGAENKATESSQPQKEKDSGRNK